MQQLKKGRHEVILGLIEDNIIVTQDELQEQLLKRGFNVTQSTVSRDIKELRIVKQQDVNGIYRYMVARPASASLGENGHDGYRDMFAKSVVSVDYSLNNVVIKCYNGMASSACVVFDALYGDLILGSLAGDDTIIIVTKDESGARNICNMLLKLIQ